MRFTFRQYKAMSKYGKFKPEDSVKVYIVFRYEDFELLDKIRALHRKLLEEGIKITFDRLLVELIEKGYNNTKNLLN